MTNVQSMTASFPVPGQLGAHHSGGRPHGTSPHPAPHDRHSDLFPQQQPRTPHSPHCGSSACAWGLPDLVPEMCEIRHPEGQTSPAGPGAGDECFILTRPMWDARAHHVPGNSWNSDLIARSIAIACRAWESPQPASGLTTHWKDPQNSLNLLYPWLGFTTANTSHGERFTGGSKNVPSCSLPGEPWTVPTPPGTHVW